MPFSACSVPACTRSSSSPAGRAASTAAARRKACTRYVGAPPRSSSNAICRSAWRGSTSGLLPTPGRWRSRASRRSISIVSPHDLHHGSMSARLDDAAFVPTGLDCPFSLLRSIAMIVSRVAERARLDALLAALIRGDGRALVVHGEAGIGKTTLLEALVERCAGAVTVVRACGAETEAE